ncbi:MAG: cupredoxin domain-containing protein [Microthrixaceae bacterium]
MNARSRPLLSLLVAVLAVLLAACGSDGAAVASGDGGSAGDGSLNAEDPPELVVVDSGAEDYDYDYVIPFGTGRRLDGGEEIEIVPAELDVEVGETIRIVNEDVRGAAVGIFWVPAERTVAMEFTTPGTLTGECDVHPSGVFTINVDEA